MSAQNVFREGPDYRTVVASLWQFVGQIKADTYVSDRELLHPPVERRQEPQRLRLVRDVEVGKAAKIA